MKKFLSILLIVSMLTVFFVSCNKGASTQTAESTSQSLIDNTSDNASTSESDSIQEHESTLDDNTTPLSDGIVFEVNSDPYTEGLLFETVPDEEGYVVVGYEGPSKNVVIPKVYRGFYVVRVLDDAFAEISKLETVSIPDSVHYIGKNTFKRCVNIKR